MDDIKLAKKSKSPNKSDDILIVNNIEVVYSHVILVLKGVSLKVKKGGITALLGGNGAGKSTTLKSISTLLSSERGEVTKGSVNFNGEDIHGLDPAQLVKKGVIQVMEGRHCFEHLTVEENLLTGAYTRTNSKETKDDLEVATKHLAKNKELLSNFDSSELVKTRELIKDEKLDLNIHSSKLRDLNSKYSATEDDISNINRKIRANC